MENGDNEKGRSQCACPCQANIRSHQRNKLVQYVHEGGKHPDRDCDEEDGDDDGDDDGVVSARGWQTPLS